MEEYTIVYWRDIPAQLIKGKGRNASKIKLNERFEIAIDRCAMKVGAKDSESYIKHWKKVRRCFQTDSNGSLESEAKILELEYTNNKLNELIANSGWEPEIQNDQKDLSK